MSKDWKLRAKFAEALQITLVEDSWSRNGKSQPKFELVFELVPLSFDINLVNVFVLFVVAFLVCTIEMNK